MAASEAVEDLTGGVTTQLLSSDIFNKERFWKEELMLANKEFLFAGSIGGTEERSGIHADHSYSVLKAVEVKGERLVMVRYV